MTKGSLWKAGEEGAGGGISKVGTGRNGKTFLNIAQYFATGKAHRGRTRSPSDGLLAGPIMEGGGNWECTVQEAGSSDPPVPPAPTCTIHVCSFCITF